MKFFRKIEIAKIEKRENKGGEHLSNGSIKPLDISDKETEVKVYRLPIRDDKTGHKNKVFQMKDEGNVGDEIKEEIEEKKAEIDKKESPTEETEHKNDSNDISPVKQIEKQVDKADEPKRRYTCWEKFNGKLTKVLDHPHLIRWVTLIVVGLALWSIIYSIAGAGFIPGSQLFSLISLFVLAYIGGEAIQLLKLPPLLGMLLTGLLLRNIGFIHLEGVYMEVTATLREIALCIILIRAGLGLDPKALKSLRFVIIRLACLPGIVEALITMIVTHFLLGLPWLWGLLLGAILAAVSPAVVIPCLFSLQERGYGTGKGIPTLVVAAASLDDILAITVFGVVLNIIYSTGTSLTMQIIQGPIGIVIGILFGILWGFVAHFVPHQKDDQVVLLRVLMIIGGGLMAIVGSGAIGYQGAGPLGCIIAAFVACLGWRRQDYSDTHNPVAGVFRVIWLIFQPILFGLIGSEVDVTVLEASTIGNGLLALFCSLLGRIVVSTFVGFGGGFNWKEKIFIAWAWFPKATVQAALGPLALDIARRNGFPDDIIYARKILILAVLAILITAPIGAALISTLGPRLLEKNDGKQTEDQNKIDEVNLESREEANEKS